MCDNINFQRMKIKGALTIEQIEGYIIALEDRKIELDREIKNYKESLEWRKKFK